MTDWQTIFLIGLAGIVVALRVLPFGRHQDD